MNPETEKIFFCAGSRARRSVFFSFAGKALNPFEAGGIPGIPPRRGRGLQLRILLLDKYLARASNGGYVRGFSEPFGTGRS
jgi:hypothetical protein